MGKMTKREALRLLEKCARCDDTESAHADADDVLIQLIDDDEIAAAYGRVAKWYA